MKDSKLIKVISTPIRLVMWSLECGVAKHLLNPCMEYLQVQLIQEVFVRKGEDFDKMHK